MDDSNNTMTHVAAICIGVLLTLGMVGVFSSNKKEQPVALASESNNTNPKKKKKRNKKKAVTSKGEESPVKEETPKQQVIIEKETTTNDNSNQQVGKKKAKKMKNNKGASNGASKEKQAAAVAVAPGAAPVKPKPAAASTTSRSSDRFEQAPAVEDEWNSVGGAKKKVKKVRVPGSSTVSAGSTSASDSISVDARKVGIIIGPKGATMLALQEATGCKLDVNAPARDGPTDANAKAGVVITGPNKESIQMAKKAIQELATKGYATLLQSDNFGEFGTEVHPRMLSEIVGPSGKTIQAIQTSLNVKITIPPTDWKPNAPRGDRQVVKPVRVGIAGTKENAKTAKAVIQALQKYHHHEVTHPGMIHKEIYVPQEFFHCVIGVRGSEIKHIRGNYKVDMYMPDSDSDSVLVVGRLANVDKAIAYIQLLMDRDADSRQQKYSDEHY
jgi:predicted PilT family ATPase